MATLGIDGLVSSLDTTSIINQLMTLEARPQTLLKSTLNSTNSFLSALRSLNASVAAIATSAKELAKPTSLAAFSAASTVDTVTATTDGTASAGSISFRVDQTAKAQTIVTAAMGAWPDDPPVLTLVAADGVKTEITATSTSLQAVAEAISAGSAGVTATRVSAGKDGNGNDLFRLQLTAAKTGGSGAFTAYRGTAADVAAGTATDLLAAAGSASVSAAADATITLWPGSAAEQQVVSATNTFDDLLTGVDVLVTKAGADPVTVSVSRNATAAANTAASLMGKLVSTFATIAAQSKVSSTTASSGAATVSGGVFTGDSAIRQLKDGLMAAVVEPVDDRSLSSIGITVTREGGIAFDAEIFKKALEADPSGTQAMFATMAGRVENAASSASDSVDGYLSQRVTGQEDTAKRLGENISAWDLRLEKRRAVLQRQYTAMETALSGLNSQSTWLASQLASLNVSTGT